MTFMLFKSFGKNVARFQRPLPSNFKEKSETVRSLAKMKMAQRINILLAISAES